MALPVLPNSSNFLAVALVINRSRDGPQFVFHYPPHVTPAQTVRRRSKTDDDFDLEDEEDLLERLARPAGPSVNPAGLMPWNQDEHFVTESGTQIVPWEHVAGFPTKDLQGILTPNRAYHKRLFQISLDGLVCVSYPIHVPENGVWKKKKKKAKKEEKARSGRKDGDDADADGGAATGDGTEAPESDKVEVKDMAMPEEDAEEVEVQVEVEEKKSSMTMFNLVFMLKPQKQETSDLVDVMFSHIIKKVNKAYKYVQQRGDFVWKESKKVLALKEKGREDKKKMSSLWNEILASSSLAASMQDLYDAISQNKIAVLQLDSAEGTVTHSVQIPVPCHLADVPQEDDTDAQGLWLTTANFFVDADDMHNDAGFLDKNFALLLMEDQKKIMSELQADPDEATLSMIEFVKHCKPTLSFHQVGQQSSNILTPTQVRKYAQHFIFWRRAIAIPPLHARDIYTLSPNCNLSKLPAASVRWTRQFPLAPALPNFLADLSVAPRPYKLYCPSKAHRPIYMTMLAWLMRGGWVTQLCTFAYVVVWPEIIYEVEHALEAEEIAKAKRAQAEGEVPGSLNSETTATSSSSDLTPTPDDIDTQLRNFSNTSTILSPNLPSSSSPTQTDMTASITTLRDLTLSPTQTNTSDANHPLSPSSPTFHPAPSRTVSPSHHHSYAPTPTPAERAAEKARLERLASRAAQTLADKATAHARKPSPVATPHPSVNDAAHLLGMTPHIILDAKKATGRESLYLDAIGRRLAKGAGRAADGKGGGRDGEGKGKSKDGEGGAGGERHHHQGITNGRGLGKDKDKVGAGGQGGKDWDKRVASAWPLFWKYFNGRSALERIALQEEMKRKDVWNLLTGMSEYLLTVRHW